MSINIPTKPYFTFRPEIFDCIDDRRTRMQAQPRRITGSITDEVFYSTGPITCGPATVSFTVESTNLEVTIVGPHKIEHNVKSPKAIADELHAERKQQNQHLEWLTTIATEIGIDLPYLGKMGPIPIVTYISIYHANWAAPTSQQVAELLKRPEFQPKVNTTFGEANVPPVQDMAAREPKTVYAWVIEKADSEPSRPVYYTGHTMPCEWSRPGDHAAALRLARREDAEIIANGLMNYNRLLAHRVKEHGWDE